MTKFNLRLRSSSQVVAWGLARSGLGMMIMPDRITTKFPEFVPVLSEIEPFRIPTWLVANSELRTGSRIWPVFDHLAYGLSPMGPREMSAP
ncbi:hypothetical protein [Jannaschia faecimaris]|uniref:hypothetical protein n=1 Tax=Jannaschia faecimaris TaxID=1244108 RepID=UPI00148007D6|nr:hypothetical protein [Jannaschia faecimaris]